MKAAKKFVVVGLSGGVDSAVAALLLQQTYHVAAVFMQNWHEENSQHCTALQDLADAQAVCEILGIELYTVNFAKIYWERVFEHFLNEYANSRTPNPDILCNKEIKFHAFLDYAQTLGADYIATGHYARRLTTRSQECLLKGRDPHKDQSYFLHLLTQAQLARTLFPLGDLTKTQVRQLALEHNLPNHAKKDSTGICFIGERNFKKFLSEYLLAKPGPIITTAAHQVGRHDGLMFYTIGQRQGLKIGGRKEHLEAPWYVAAKELAQNALIVTQDRNHPLLARTELTCAKVHWIAQSPPKFPFSCTAKIRYRQADQECLIHQMTPEQLTVSFTQPQWAITPGQSVVFYKQDSCLGGGIIL